MKVMGNFFGSIYCWFENFFGIELADYLWGYSSPYSETNSFIGIGLWTLAISAAVVVLFYYVIDHPRFNTWWAWLIVLVTNAALNLALGVSWVWADYVGGKMVKEGEIPNEEIALNIWPSDLWAFGVSNMFISVLFFLVLTFLLKEKSKNCSSTPFSWKRENRAKKN